MADKKGRWLWQNDKDALKDKQGSSSGKAAKPETKGRFVGSNTDVKIQGSEELYVVEIKKEVDARSSKTSIEMRSKTGKAPGTRGAPRRTTRAPLAPKPPQGGEKRPPAGENPFNTAIMPAVSPQEVAARKQALERERSLAWQQAVEEPPAEPVAKEDAEVTEAAPEQAVEDGPVPADAAKAEEAVPKARRPKKEKEAPQWPERPSVREVRQKRPPAAAAMAHTEELAALAFVPKAKGTGIGNLLYALGYAAEYQATQVWRVVRDVSLLVGQILLWLLRILGRWVAGFFRGIGRDLASPFVRFRRRQRQLARIRARQRQRAKAAGGAAQKRSFLGVSLNTGLRFVAGVIAILLPMGAALAMGYTVYSVVGMDYGLAVELNGQVIGYVTDQSVMENAKVLLRDRIRLASGQEVTDWQLTPTYSIARTEQFTTTQQLTNEILNVSVNPQDLVRATGLYIDGNLYAVTDRGDDLKVYLDTILEEQWEKVPDDVEASVDFVRAVECEPQDDPEKADLFFAESLIPYDELIEQLNQNVEGARVVVASGGETLAEIAVNNNITLEALMGRNPDFEGQPEDFAPPAGKSVTIHNAQPFLQVRTTYRLRSTEPIPYTSRNEETMDLQKGVLRVKQEGVDGVKEVWDDYIYIDGELERRERVDELTQVLQPPVEEIILVGLYDFSDVMVTGDYISHYMWPVPAATYSSRGISAHHRGQDINAATGTPIFACNAGIVKTAGWHYSWGYHIVIEHPDGISTLYAHCSSLAVEAGDVVRQAQYIGAVGNTGNSFGSHLHLEFQYQGGLLNPRDYVVAPDGFTFRGG